MPVYADDEAGDALRGVLRAGHPWDLCDRPLAVLYAYGDMSGTRHTRVYVMACWMGTEPQWADVDARWGKVLEWANVDHFHATDFFNCKGAFRAWKKGSVRHREAEQRFVAVIADAGLAGSVFGVEAAGFDADYQAAYNRSRSPKFQVKTVRRLSMQLCCIGIRDFMRLGPARERVQLVLEREQGIGDVITFFNLEKRRRESWTQGIISVTTAGKKDLRPLQVADFLAYEAYQYFTHYVGDHGAPTPPRFARMVASKLVRWKCGTAAGFRDLLPTVQQTAETHHSDRIPKPGERKLPEPRT